MKDEAVVGQREIIIVGPTDLKGDGEPRRVFEGCLMVCKIFFETRHGGSSRTILPILPVIEVLKGVLERSVDRPFILPYEVLPEAVGASYVDLRLVVDEVREAEEAGSLGQFH